MAKWFFETSRSSHEPSTVQQVLCGVFVLVAVLSLPACSHMTAQPLSAAQHTANAPLLTPAPGAAQPLAASALPTLSINPNAPVAPVPERDTRCPRLESALYALAQAPDPLAEAHKLGLRVQEDRLQVLVVLAGEESSFLSDFNALPGSRQGQDLQAFVPPAQLCALSNHPQVLAVRLPASILP